MSNDIIELAGTFRNNDSIQTKHLLITWTNKLWKSWDDQGSEAEGDVTFAKYREISHGGSSGVIAYGGYDSPDKHYIMRLTATRDLDDGSSPIVNPTDFQPIWNDSGSGARQDGSVWRPIHSSGNYVALSDFAHNSHSKPNRNDTIMVHKSLVSPAYIGNTPIWTDKGSGAKNDFSAWPIHCSKDTQLRNGNDAFVGTSSHDRPGTSVYCLDLNMSQFLDVLVPIPTETGRSSSEPVLVSKQYIPFYEVRDHVISDDQSRVAHGVCWYVLEVYNAWTEVSKVINDNTKRLESSYSLKYGVSETESQQFMTEAGIALSMTQTVSVGGKIKAVDVSSTTSVTVSGHYTVGRTQSSSETVTREGTHTIKMDIEPNSTGVIYQLKATALLKRGSDGAVVRKMDIPTQSYRVVTS